MTVVAWEALAYQRRATQPSSAAGSGPGAACRAHSIAAKPQAAAATLLTDSRGGAGAR